MARRILPSRETQIRFFKSLTVGGTAFIVQMAAIWVLKGFLRPMHAFWTAWATSVATHYTLNRFWALRSARRDTGRQFLEYAGTVAIGWIIQTCVFKFCFSVVGLSIMWSTFFAVPPSTVAVIAIMHYHVFRVHA